MFLLFWFLIMSVGLIAGAMVYLTQISWQELGLKPKSFLKSIGLGLLGFVLMYLNVIV